MNAELRELPAYEAPAIEDRAAIDTPLIGRTSLVECAAFNHE